MTTIEFALFLLFGSLMAIISCLKIDINITYQSPEEDQKNLSSQDQKVNTPNK